MTNVERVENYLEEFGLKESILTSKSCSATVEMAAEAFNTKPERIAKTLSFYKDDGTYLVIVTAGNMKIDNPKYKAEFNCKAHMVPFEDVEPKIGHPVGGVCPFALNDGVEVYLDESLKKYETVFPACGSDHNAIEITPEKLSEVSKMIKWVNVCKEPEN